MKRTVIIGGGASGMTAAIKASGRGQDTLILEHTDTLGKKILATGNGRCNLTNLRQSADCYSSGDKHFADSVLSRYGAENACRFFEDLGIRLCERDGYVYPRSMQASCVRAALVSALEENGAKVIKGCTVDNIIKSGDVFTVHTDKGAFTADKVILCCGGKASPSTGSDGSGYELAERLGHTIITPVPALVPLTAKDEWLNKAAGVRANARVMLEIEGHNGPPPQDTGQLQITDYGISGIPVFQVSRHAARALYEGRKVTAVINFIPEEDQQKAASIIRGMLTGFRERELTQVLAGLFPMPLARALARSSGIPDGTPAGGLSQLQTNKLERRVLSYRVPITGTKPFDMAQTTAGGVDLHEINPMTMESYIVPGLYFAGEIMDADGICGGYNLHWAWATGSIAGEG